MRYTRAVAQAKTSWLEGERAELERRLAGAVPEETVAPCTLHRAMRYSLLSGGKRLRPLLCRAAAYAVAGHDVEHAWGPAVAVELVHTYSLIHDDLPALDNDDLRRGRPTCHKVFGEAMAILAGDALLTLAFEHLPKDAMARALARAAGTPLGMVAGQAADLAAEAGGADTLEEVRWIHRAKTAALIASSARLGGMAAGATPEQLEDLGRFGEAAGLAFQITDDLLDCTASTEQLGKTAGKDEAQAKLTFPAVAGAERAAEEARRLLAEALEAVAGWPAAERLRTLAGMMVERRR